MVSSCCSRPVLRADRRLRCPQQTGAETPSPIEVLRDRAERAPQNAGLAAELAAAEMLMDGGEAERARPAVDHALELSPSDPGLLFLSGVLHHQHGHARPAVDAHLAAIDAARGSDGPLAPAVAELAMRAAASLRGQVAGWDDIAMPVYRRAVTEPGKLGQPAFSYAAYRVLGDEWRRGVAEAEQNVVTTLGCITEWRTAGPFGPFVWSTFDGAVPGEGPGPLADEYDLGPGIGEKQTREAETRGCNVPLGGLGVFGSGNTVAESFVDVTEAGEHLLIIDAGLSYRVKIDGEQVGVVDRRERILPGTHFFPVQLSAGRHEIEIKVAGPGGNMTVYLERADRVASGYDPSRGAEPPDGESLLAALVRGRLWHIRGDAVSARESLNALDASGAPTTALLARARVAGRDPFLPQGERDELVKRLYEEAAERDPGAWFPRLRLAQLEQGSREYFERVGEVADAFPEVLPVQLARMELLRRQGFVSDADAILAGLRERMPEDCGLLHRQYAVHSDRGRVQQANALVEAIVACDARSRARFDLFMHRALPRILAPHLRNGHVETVSHPLRNGLDHPPLLLQRARAMHMQLDQHRANDHRHEVPQ